MATTVTDAASPSATAMAEERVKLRKVLRRFDLVCFTIAAFIALDTIAATAAYGGGETLFWVGFVIVLYMIPSGLICAELGSTFPIEGGPCLGGRRLVVRDPGLHAVQRQPVELLRRDAVDRDLAHRAAVRLHLPRGDRAAEAVSRPQPALPHSRRRRGHVDLRHRHRAYRCADQHLAALAGSHR